MSMDVMIKAILLIYCSVSALQSENIDTLEPIMRLSPELGETVEDYFGYTLVLHQLDVAGDLDNTRYVVFHIENMLCVHETNIFTLMVSAKNSRCKPIKQESQVISLLNGSFCESYVSKLV